MDYGLLKVEFVPKFLELYRFPFLEAIVRDSSEIRRVYLPR